MPLATADRPKTQTAFLAVRKINFFPQQTVKRNMTQHSSHQFNQDYNANLP